MLLHFSAPLFRACCSCTTLQYPKVEAAPTGSSISMRLDSLRWKCMSCSTLDQFTKMYFKILYNYTNTFCKQMHHKDPSGSVPKLSPETWWMLMDVDGRGHGGHGELDLSCLLMLMFVGDFFVQVIQLHKRCFSRR